MNKKFVIGFIAGLLLFFAINLLVAHLASGCSLATFSPGSARLGWPLRFHESGWFIYQQNFNTAFLVIDLAVGFLLAMLLALLISGRKKLLPK